MSNTFSNNDIQKIPFKAETRQILNILIHSLYSDREVFLRELISNASDALTRINYEMLTNRDVVTPDAELAIWITTDSEQNTITITDSGIGMDEGEIIENLGTIAHSGAYSFIEAVKDNHNVDLSQIIGKFGVGFYSVFMVAESVQVISRSFKSDAKSILWISSGEDSYSLEAGQKDERGTSIIIKLKSDASEFSQEYRIRQIITKHSDFVPFPIYLGESKEQVNHQTALWREQPHKIDIDQYHEFYRQFTLDYEKPITYLHLSIDAPIQVYALLYVPQSAERNPLATRTQDGIKLYAKKILIQEYCQDLLPGFFRFIQGIVDSEDIPLNISRETYQSSRSIAQIKKLLTSKIIEKFKDLSLNDTETYQKFWKIFGSFIKEGIATNEDYHEDLIPLLRFHSLSSPDELLSLDQYCENIKPDQQKIYFIVGDDDRSIINSPHLEAFKKYNYDVLLFTDPIDSFMLIRLKKYKDHDFSNVSSEKLDIKDNGDISEKDAEKDSFDIENKKIIDLFKTHLGDRITDVRSTNQLVESPARLVDPEGTLSPEYQHVYKLLNKNFEIPKKVLEINLRHPIINQINLLASDHIMIPLVIEQIYENSLLIEGLHPDPASMIKRVQTIMEYSLKINTEQ